MRMRMKLKIVQMKLRNARQDNNNNHNMQHGDTNTGGKAKMILFDFLTFQLLVAFTIKAEYMVWEEGGG